MGGGREAIVEGVGSVGSPVVAGDGGEEMRFARAEGGGTFGFGGPGEGAKGGFEVGAEVEEEDGI